MSPRSTLRKRNVCQALWERQSTAKDACLKMISIKNAMKQIDISAKLEGHNGCVNCLEWSKDGSVLLSGSDDTTLRIWDPIKHKCLSTIKTVHKQNIFTAKFIPESNNEQIASGAGDGIVSLIRTSVGKTTMICECHRDRVKRIATVPGDCHTIWSAAEDGLVMEYDLRVPHTCQTSGPAVVVDLRLLHDFQMESPTACTQAKCVAINPLRPHLIAVGANDKYARVFDRRYIKNYFFKNAYMQMDDAKTASTNVYERAIEYQKSLAGGERCAQYFTPGHLTPFECEDINLHNRKYATTNVQFSPDGHELLVNLAGDHIYLYDINASSNYKSKLTRPDSVRCDTELNGNVQCCDMPCVSEEIPREYFTFEKKKGFVTNVDIPHTNESQQYCSCELIARGDAYITRHFAGDYYAAALCYLRAMEMRMGTSLYRRPFVGLVFALALMKWSRTASKWYRTMFNSTNDQSSVAKLLRDTIVAAELDNKLEMELVGRPSHDFLYNGTNEMDVARISKQIKSKGLYITFEETWRETAKDFSQRFVGHSSTTTDIKEATFLTDRDRGDLIAAGSDDGVLFVWQREDSKIVAGVKGDQAILNCVQAHPYACMVATSGIDDSIKLWEPFVGYKSDVSRALSKAELTECIELNQHFLVDQIEPFIPTPDQMELCRQT